MARPNYSGEKRRKELEKQKKKEAKKQRKLENAAGPSPSGERAGGDEQGLAESSSNIPTSPSSPPA
ncbi:MAG: hypothetical protein H0X40_01800 [Chthoniobacterales bacterium]|nr:hypothetical protein [Chthoniobacterales bacterium]